MASLLPIAQRGQQALEADQKALEAKLARLGAVDRAALEQLPANARSAVADRLLAAPGAFRTPPVIGGGPPSPANAPVDIERLIQEPGGLAKAKRDHGDEWSAYCRSKSGFGSVTESGAFFTRGATAAQKAASARGHRR